MKKLTKIQLAQAKLVMGYLMNFKVWPQSVSAMIENWQMGFFNAKTRKKDLTLILNYLCEIGKIEILPIGKTASANLPHEIGFRLVGSDEE